MGLGPKVPGLVSAVCRGKKKKTKKTTAKKKLNKAGETESQERVSNSYPI